MSKKSSALLLALFTSAGLAMAAEGDNGAGILGPDPTHVSGANQKGAGPTGVGGTGMSAKGAGAATSGASRQNDGSGTAYIDCPGNAFSGGIRNDPKGQDCVPPDSVVIQGDSNMTRDVMNESLPQKTRSPNSGAMEANNAASGSSSAQANNLGGDVNGTGTETVSSGESRVPAGSAARGAPGGSGGMPDPTNSQGAGGTTSATGATNNR